MTLHIETQSGAHYEIDEPIGRIRRHEGASANSKRADGEWVSLIYLFEPIVGASLVFAMESLSSRGPDDYGTETPTDVTTRTTTPVVRVWRDEEG